MKSALPPPITDRALSQNLKHLHAQNWITRAVEADIHPPPRALYQATGPGADIAAAAAALIQ